MGRAGAIIGDILRTEFINAVCDGSFRELVRVSDDELKDLVIWQAALARKTYIIHGTQNSYC